MRSEPYSSINILKTGYWSSITLAVLTLITFAVAITAVPKSGSLCTGECIDYPYLDSLKFYPGDYYWMFVAMFQIFAWLIFMISIHFTALPEKKIYSFISISFALMSSIILSADYFIQFTVIPISLIKGETDGIALLTQYNEHGIFIALEELGFILMSFSLLFMVPVISKEKRLTVIIRWILIISFILVLFSFVFFLIIFGTDRGYRFEITVISINWLTLILIGILTAGFFKRQLSELK